MVFFLFEELIFWSGLLFFGIWFLFFILFNIIFKQTFTFLMFLFYLLLSFFLSFLGNLFYFFKFSIQLIFIIFLYRFQILFRFFFCFSLLFIPYKPFFPWPPHYLILVFNNILSSLNVKHSFPHFLFILYFTLYLLHKWIKLVFNKIINIVYKLILNCECVHILI